MKGGGHWRLHRGLVRADRDQGALFADVPKPTVVCRSSQAKDRVEWQADFYASCLLMPRRLVHARMEGIPGADTAIASVSDLRPNGKVMMRAQTLIL